jgi:hypothetical protein
MAVSPESIPPELDRTMRAALADRDGDARTALAAAEACLRRALERIDKRAVAIELLAADALLTDACARAAGAGVGALAAEATERLTALLEPEANR